MLHEASSSSGSSICSEGASLGGFELELSLFSRCFSVMPRLTLKVLGNKKRQIWQRKRNTEEGNKPQEDPKDKIGEDLRDSDGDSVEVIRHVGNLLNDDDSPTESELGISLNTGTETETSAMMPMLERGNRSLNS